MRKTVLIFGAIYSCLGFLLLNTAWRMLELYRQFEAELPLLTYISLIFYVFLPLFGISQLIIYFKRIKKESLYKTLLILDVIILFFGLAFFVTALILPIYNLTTTL